MLSEGDILGPYKIQKRIRGGGMATLFLAQREGARGFARHLAIKVVNEDLAQDDVFVEMFIDEANLAAQINHPNVVHVEDFGEADGNFFIAMEYIHGCSLAQLLRALIKQKRRLTPELSVYIAVKVAEGLHAAHEATDRTGASLDVVHRDVNPANVLLDYKGHVKLIDFGIAKSTSRAHHTTGGSLKGKLRYMSPEQAMGKDIDRRADVYALGITLWEILTARRLFDAETDIQVLESVRSPNLEPPSRYAEGVSPELDAVVMSALNPAADARTATALEFRRQLTRVIPAGAMLESSTLAELLAIVMRKEIKKGATKLPESLAGGAQVIPSEEDDDEVLRTMTISDVGIEAGNSTERTSVSNSIPGDPNPPREATPAQPDVSIAAGPAAPPLARPLDAPAELGASAPGTRRWPILLAAGAFLAVGFAVGLYAVGGAGDKSIESTPLDGPAVPETASPSADPETTSPSDVDEAANGDLNGAGASDASTDRATVVAPPDETDSPAPDPGARPLPDRDPVAPSAAMTSSAMRSGRDRDRSPRMTMMSTTPAAMMRTGAPALVDDVF